MFSVKVKPNIPSTIGTKPITAELAIVSGSTIYLLPGVTKQNKELVSFIPFRSGEKGSPKSLRENISKLKVFVWYDLPIAAKKEAMAALLAHFDNNVDEVARALGHTTDYVLHLNETVDDGAEFELAGRTEINPHVMTQFGVAKDPLSFFLMSDEAGRLFLESTRASWLDRVFDGQDPFVQKTVETANKTTLGFLLSLGKPRLFDVDQVKAIIAKSEAGKDYSLLPELCHSLGFANEQQWVELVFPNETAVKKMTDEQIGWRINLMDAVKSHLIPTLWSPAFKGLSVLNLVHMGTHLLPQYVIENLNLQQGVTPYIAAVDAYRDVGGLLIEAKMPGKILFAATPIPAARVHYMAYQNWSQSIAQEHARVPRTNDADMMLLLVQTAIPTLKVEYWPEFLGKQMRTNEPIKLAMIQFLMYLIERHEIALDKLEEENLRATIPGFLMGNLDDNEKTGVLLYGQVVGLATELSNPKLVLTRSHVLKVLKFLNILVQLSTAEEKANIESLAFYKLINAIAAPNPQKTDQFTMFEMTLLKRLLLHADAFFDKFAANTLALKVLRTILVNLAKVPKYALEAIPDMQVKIAQIEVPPKGSVAEKAWIEKNLLAFEKAAAELKAKAQYRDGGAEMMARGLRIVYRDLEDIRRTFMAKKPGLDAQLAQGVRNPDDSFVKEGVYVHFTNAKTRNDRTGLYSMEWSTMEAILKDIVRRVLILYVSAEEWKRVDGNSDKLNDLFGRFGGYCIEGRTVGVLFDNIPPWLLWQDGQDDPQQKAKLKMPQEIVDDMDTLVQKMQQLSDDIRDYLGKYGQAYTETDAKELIWAWFNGKSYQEGGRVAKLTQEFIEPMVEALGVPKIAAESLLAANVREAAQQGLRRAGMFPDDGRAAAKILPVADNVQDGKGYY